MECLILENSTTSGKMLGDPSGESYNVLVNVQYVESSRHWALVGDMLSAPRLVQLS